MRGIALRFAALVLLAIVVVACAGNDRRVSSDIGGSGSAAPALWPVAQQTRAISSAYGAARGRGSDFHRGIDIRAPAGTPVLATATGRVIVAGNGSGYGRYVVLDHENGLRTLYAHLQDFVVSPGDRVARGQQIGRVGKSGNATGYHLHYEVHRGGQSVDPIAYLP
jgi:murein DD-endopeptidase MepM/ murein hydrolase activator NlpD